MISFLSYSSDPVIPSIGLDVHFQIKDGDGDVENTLSFAAIYDLQPEPDTAFTHREMPNLDAHNGTNLTAEVILHLEPIDFPNTGIQKDSVHYVAYITDNAGNISDTIATPKVEIIYQ
jgi:hypothetical protein